MGSMFSKPKAVSTPAMSHTHEPPLTPQTTSVSESGDSAIKQARERKSFSKAIITGNLAPTPKKKTVLG